jgi:hypothetical protein
MFVPKKKNWVGGRSLLSLVKNFTRSWSSLFNEEGLEHLIFELLVILHLLDTGSRFQINASQIGQRQLDVNPNRLPVKHVPEQWREEMFGVKQCDKHPGQLIHLIGRDHIGEGDGNGQLPLVANHGDQLHQLFKSVRQHCLSQGVEFRALGGTVTYSSVMLAKLHGYQTKICIPISKKTVLVTIIP